MICVDLSIGKRVWINPNRIETIRPAPDGKGCIVRIAAASHSQSIPVAESFEDVVKMLPASLPESDLF